MNTLILKYKPSPLINKAIALLVSISGVKIEHSDDETFLNENDIKLGEESLKSGFVSEKDFEKTLQEALKKAK